MRNAALSVCVILALASGALAADPSGVWKYTVEFNEMKIDSVATLKLEGGKLTGTVKRASGEMEAKIEEGTFKEDEVSFQVTRDAGGNKFVIKYKGKITGDDLKGKISGSFMGNDFEIDWNAKREKK